MSNFKPLTPHDYPLLKKFFLNVPYSLSIYSLPSLIAWSQETQPTTYSLVDDLLVIASDTDNVKKTPPYLILPLSPAREPSPGELYSLAGDYRFDEYRFIPEDYLARQLPGEIEKYFIVEEQPEYADYIYLTRDLSELAGRKYAKKRNLINQFTRDHQDGKVQTEFLTADLKQECLDFMERWCEEYPCEGPDKESLMCEKKAIAVSLDNLELFELCGQVVRVEGVVSAFGIVARLNERMGILHFEKAFARIHGLYQYLDWQCARTCLSRYEFINKESDMGLPGLTQAKKSYFPSAMVKSYRLIRR